jgi:hypothetical protein
VSTYGDTLVVSGEDEVADEVRRGAVILRVRLPTSIISCRGEGGRLEQARAARCFCRGMDASFCSANEQMEVFRGSAVTREKGWEEEEGKNLLGSVDFIQERPQVQATPARNSASLAARSTGEGRGEWRGGVGNL